VLEEPGAGCEQGSLQSLREGVNDEDQDHSIRQEPAVGPGMQVGALRHSAILPK
jgi:hypothetical protein